MVCWTAAHDIWFGSCGSLLPSIQAKIVSIEGVEITGYDQPGELVVKSPTVVLGYLNNPQANKETFVDGWMRTGDEAVVRKSPNGNEHIFIVDRIKELIKVKVRNRRFTLMGRSLLTMGSRECKLLLQNWRRIYSLIPLSMMQPSSLYPMMRPASCQRPS